MSETTKRDDGGMTGRYLVVNRATGQVVTDVDDWAEAVDVRDGCEEDSPNHAYLIAEVRGGTAHPTSDAVARNYVPENNGIRCDDALALLSLADRIALVEAGRALAETATPPTPDLDAVREALVRVLGAGTSDLDAYEALGAGLGLGDPSPRRIADALLAAVSRPAEARGEPVPSFWAVLREDNETMATGKTHDEAVREFMRFRSGDYANAVKEGYRCVAIFTNWPVHPAPSGGEAERCGCYEDGEFRYYCRGHAAPRPEPENPSEAMVEAMAKAAALKNSEVAGAPWSQMDVDENWPDIREEWVQTLRAALAAERGTP